MYPLNLKRMGLGYVQTGFAVANDADEHQRLSDDGYEPKIVAPDAQEADATESDASGHTVASVRTTLDVLNIPYDKRLGLEKLKALLPV